MARRPLFVDAEDSVRHAAEVMQRCDVGALPVRALGHWVGMVTDRDLALRAVARGLNPEMATIRQVMTPDLVYCFAEQPLREAVETMLRNTIRRLAVLDSDLELIGMLSVDDLASATPHSDLVAQVLAHIAPPIEVAPSHH
jgi:CBS domain-containing protein